MIVVFALHINFIMLATNTFTWIGAFQVLLVYTGVSLTQVLFCDWLESSRIVMPLSLEEYEIAQAYTVIKMQQESATSTEGVEVLESRPFEDNVYGKGHYTSKVYRFQSKIPTWITSFAAADSLIMQEEAWNAYPRCKSVIKCPCFNKLVLTVETIHVADNGKSENVHGVNKQKLGSRQVETIDIASSVRDCWSYLVGCCDVDFSEFRSAMTARGPLLEGWREGCSPVMTAYKLVTVDAPYWGFGKRLEQAIMAGERALFLESHRRCFAWIDHWYGMSSLQLRQLENQCCAEEARKPGSIKAVERRCLAESEETFKSNDHHLCCRNT